MKHFPVPDIEIRKTKLHRKCYCGNCKYCRNSDAKLRAYRRRKAGIPPRKIDKSRFRKAKRDDIDMDQLNAYWEKVKTI
jgi:hypothetical protein